MWTIHRTSSPQLRLVSGAIARRQGDQVTLFPLVQKTDPVDLGLLGLPEGGVAVTVKSGEKQPEVIASYPNRRLARRQLANLGVNPNAWGWLDWLGRGSLAAVILFMVWFLFFLPVDPAYRAASVPGSLDAMPPAPGGPSAGVPVAPAVAPPALIDDPAVMTTPHTASRASEPSLFDERLPASSQQ
ncbi:MAG: hypothetical protein HC808_19265 [Candidatus Competibacteraceae bacterium]|nr:hypothetical protein [Candidatus Competibacteraceae bacterium]